MWVRGPCQTLCFAEMTATHGRSSTCQDRGWQSPTASRGGPETFLGSSYCRFEGALAPSLTVEHSRNQLMKTGDSDDIQGPSEIAILLDRFVADTEYVPPCARLITSVQDLPERLSSYAGRVVADEAWRAWESDGRVWFITGRLSPMFARLDRPALRVFFYSPEGALVTSGIWGLRDDGHWSLCEV